MIDLGDYQLFLLYGVLAFATLAFYPGSPCARKHDGDRGAVETSLQVFLIVAGMSVFLWPFGVWIGFVLVAHGIFSGYVAWGKWRFWTVSWLAQAIVIYSWLVLNPARPVASSLLE